MNFIINSLTLSKRKDKEKRLISFFLFLSFLFFSNFLYAQNTNVTLSVNNTNIKEVFGQIEKQTSYKFSYREADVANKQNVTISVSKEKLETLLETILKPRQLDYKIMGNKVLVFPFEGKNNANGKQILVKGKITDSKGDPLIGVSVVIANEKNVGTVTDLDGGFSFAHIKEGALLRISYIGYQSQEVAATSNLHIVLKEDTKVLDEVVVVGYAIQKKVNLSGAVANISPERINDRPVVNVGQALQGAVANLNIGVGSGQATDSPTFNIRGVTSLNGGSPLIVIDGVISDRTQLNRMSPTDIAGISILKDAASSAIYGSRAAYGVILVTTKSGKDEKITIHYNNNFSMKTITQMPEIITDPYIVAKTKNVMSYPWYNLFNEEQLAYAKKCSEDPSTSPYFVNPNGEYSYFGNTDWVDEAYKKNAFSTSHSIDLSGKTKYINYYLSTGYTFQDGMIKYGTDKYNNYNLRAKLDFNISNNWSISNNTSFNTSDYDAPTSLGGGYYWEINRLNPLDVPRNPNGTWTKAGSSQLGVMSEGGRSKDNKTIIRTQFGSKLDLIKDVLWVQGTFAYTTVKDRSKWNYIPVAYYEGENFAPRFRNEITSSNASSSDSKHLLYDIYGTFSKTFAKKHAITAIAGFNQEEYRYDYMNLGRKDLISSDLPSYNLATGDMNVSESIETWALRGAFGRLSYIFDDKYIVEFNGRYDGTSRFPKDSRFVFNPSGSLAWVISKEKFFKPIETVVDFMKIRGSYGSLGNQDVGAYDFMALMSSGKISAILNGKQPVAVYAPGLVSSNFTWEKATTFNLGLDFNLLNNRLTFNGDMYVRRTKNMLTAGQPLPGVLGTDIPTENAADLKTKGWEITLGWNDRLLLAGKDLNYQINFNLADSRSYITRFKNPKGELSSHYVGEEIGEIWGFKTLGFFTSNEEIKNHADQSALTSYPGTRPLAPGDLKFEDTNNNKIVSWGGQTLANHDDWQIIGNNRPRYTFGFNASAQWNGIDLSLFIQGVGKKDYMPGPGDLYFWGIYSQPWANITKGNYNDRWTEENPRGYFPRFKAYVAEQRDKEAGLSQTRYLQDASYARLKNFTIGYTLPTLFTNKLHINKLRIFFSGDNLFEVSGLYKNYKVDPEGLGGQLYPFQRSYSFGLNVSI